MPNRLFVLLQTLCAVVLFTIVAAPLASAQDVPRSAAVPKARTGSAVYIVQMIDPPVAGYTGGRPGLSATAPGRGQKISPADPDVVRYAGYLDSRHDDAVARVGARKLYGYRYAFNGFTAALTREQVAALKAIPGVIAVEETREVPMDTATTPAFLGLTQAGTGLWTRGIKGEDVIIGILDSGIWPESQSFSDRTGVGPKGQEGKLAYHQIPGWHGKCASGEDSDGSFNASLCNQKLIGAQFFCEARGCDTVLPHEFLSPRDFNGHGTHTASTAGGNEGVDHDRRGGAVRQRQRYCAARADRRLQGLLGQRCTAAAARIPATRWPRSIRPSSTAWTSSTISICGTSTNYLDAVEVAFLFAARAGVFVATSAGNSGPTREHRGAHQPVARVGRGRDAQPIGHGERSSSATAPCTPARR